MKLIVMRVDKEMSTNECIEHAQKLKLALGLDVLVVDNKVKEISTVEVDEGLILGDYIILDGTMQYIRKEDK